MVLESTQVFQRNTAARGKVLQAIERQTGHFTAEDMSQQLPGVGRATVYRTLGKLTRSGYLCKVLLGGNTLHYQVSPEEHHHHLVCIECDRIVDVESCEVADYARETARAQGFQLQRHRLEVYGRCPSCQTG
jgi:Fur family ferric uptake transcriptional regulator